MQVIYVARALTQVELKLRKWKKDCSAYTGTVLEVSV